MNIFIHMGETRAG